MNSDGPWVQVFPFITVSLSFAWCCQLLKCWRLFLELPAWRRDYKIIPFLHGKGTDDYNFASDSYSSRLVEIRLIVAHDQRD